MLSPKQVQSDFSAGACPSFARDQIPNAGAYAIENGLLDSDGALYKRGGSALLSTANFGTTGLRFIWDGYINSLKRTLIADGANFAVLDGAEAPINIGGGGLPNPMTTALLKGMLFIGGGTMWAGSLKTASYSTGTVALTNGSSAVVGTGTSWLTTVDVGMIFRRSGERAYVVASVADNTHLTLTEAYVGVTGTGIAYAASPTITASAPYQSANLYAVAGSRVIAAVGNRWYFSEFDNPHIWNANDYWDLPEGVQITGVSGIDNTVRLLTTEGMWQADNVELDSVDYYGNPQHNLRQVSKDIILWSAVGMATWENKLIVPAVDGVWLVGGTSYEKLSNSFDAAYVAHVNAGRRTGQAIVYNSHYLLPIIENDNTVVEVLVCRLDHPTRVRNQTVYAWSKLTGAGANCPAFASRVLSGSLRALKLLGADKKASGTYIGRVLDCSGIFTPSTNTRVDHDGTVPRLILDTRDYATGPLTQNLVKGMRLGYRLIDASAENPRLYAMWSDGRRQSSGSYWGSAFWGTGKWTADTGSEFVPFEDFAPADDGLKPKFWRMRLGRARTRYIRFRITSENASSECTLRSIELFTRKSGRL